MFNEYVIAFGIEAVRTVTCALVAWYVVCWAGGLFSTAEKKNDWTKARVGQVVK